MSVLKVRGGARLDKVRGDAIVVLDLQEHERRQRAGLGAFLQLHVLHTLSLLTPGAPVPLEWLHERDQRRVRQMPASVVEVTAEGAVRHARMVVEVIGAEVASGTWTSRLRRAADLARYTPTSIVLSKPASTEQLCQADFYGVGVIERRSGAGASTDRRVLDPVVPAPCQRPVQWWFYEHAYAALLTRSN